MQPRLAKSSDGTKLVNHVDMSDAVDTEVIKRETPSSQGRTVSSSSPSSSSQASSSFSSSSPSSPHKSTSSTRRHHEHRSTKASPISRSTDRETFIKSLTTTIGHRNPAVVELRSPTAVREALKLKFYQEYYSNGSGIFPGFEHMVELAKDSPAMRLTLDTAFLAVIGNALNEPRLLNQARTSYSRALHCFRDELPRPSQALVAVAHVLILCEMFQIITQDGLNWRRHTEGLRYIMKQIPKDQLGKGYFAALLTSNVRVPFALWNGLITRKLGTNVEKMYSREVAGAARIPGTVTDFHALSKRVPGVLQRVDEVCSKKTKADLIDITGTLSDIMIMERLMHNWMVEWVSTLEALPYGPIHVSQLDHSSLRHLGDEAVFPHVYRFVKADAAIIMISYWMCLLNLRQSHFEIRNAVGEDLYPFSYSSTQLKRLQRETYECADSLCMSLPYLGLPESGYLGLVSTMAPIQFASIWYKAMQDKPKLEWCRQAADQLKMRGLCVSILGMTLADDDDKSEDGDRKKRKRTRLSD